MLQTAPDLDFLDTKPALESFGGRLVRKMSPRRRHARLQLALGLVLAAWARGRGEAGSEWRFYLLEPRGRWSSLVPDLAYVSFERLPRDARPEFRERPTIAPDLVIEILSPRERPTIVAEKVALYLAFGSRAAIVADPAGRSFEVVTPSGRRHYVEGERLLVDGFEGFTLDVAAVFAETD